MIQTAQEPKGRMPLDRNTAIAIVGGEEQYQALLLCLTPRLR